MKTETQSQLIAQHLRSGKAITPIEALRLYGCLRLGARIYDLRQRGMNITSTTIEKGGKRFAQYRLDNLS